MARPMKFDSNSLSHINCNFSIFCEMVCKVRLPFIDRLEKNVLHVEKK